MRKINVAMDGACLFRSLATSLFYKEYRINIGGGTYLGEEETVGDLANNVLSRWVRLVVTHAMFYGPVINMDTDFAGQSMNSVMDGLFALIQSAGGPRYYLSNERDGRKLKRHFLRYAPLRGVPTENIMFEDTPIELVSMSGRYKYETHGEYCKRMSHLNVWGGAGECFVASRVFQYVINIKKGRKNFQKYVPKKVKGILHVCFSSKYQHYDALI
jgi:hypothetical protein